MRPFGASKVPEGQIMFFVGRSEHRRVTLTERIIHTRKIARNAGRIEHRRVTFTGASFTRARSACLSQRYERHVLKESQKSRGGDLLRPERLRRAFRAIGRLGGRTRARSRPAPRRTAPWRPDMVTQRRRAVKSTEGLRESFTYAAIYNVKCLFSVF